MWVTADVGRERAITIRGYLKILPWAPSIVLRGISEELREAEDTVDTIRERKWDLVKQLKDLGHDFTASTEGMDVVLSAPPSMRF